MPNWAYSGCKFCRGRGCLACEGERQRDEERRMNHAFNNPILVINGLDDAQNWEILKKVFNRENVEKCFEVLDNFIRAIHRERREDSNGTI